MGRETGQSLKDTKNTKVEKFIIIVEAKGDVVSS